MGSILGVRTVFGPIPVVDLREIDSRNEAVRCALDRVDTRLDGVTPRFVAEIRDEDEWFGVEHDSHRELGIDCHPSASSSLA